MRLLASLFGERKGMLAFDETLYPLLRGLFGYGETRSGPVVNHRTALEVTTVLACATVVSNGVAMAPWKVYRPREGGGSDAATGHNLYWLLYRQPNPWQTSFEFRQTIVFHRLLTGNAFIWINRVNGRIKELIPIEPGCVEVVRQRDLSLRYRVTLPPTGSRLELPASDVWHLRGPSWNSWLGLDAVRLTREAIGLAMGSERFQAELQQDGGRQAGVLSVPDKLTTEQQTALQTWIASQVAGAMNRLKPLIMDRGATWSSTSMTARDQQLMETRKFEVEEICRGLNVKPIMIGVSDKNTSYSSSEQQYRAHVLHTLSPYWEEIQQSADVNLIGPRDPVYNKFTAEIFLRGDMQTEGEYFAKALGSGGTRGWMTQNEVRELKEMNPLAGGNELPMATNDKRSTGNAPADVTA